MPNVWLGKKKYQRFYFRSIETTGENQKKTYLEIINHIHVILFFRGANLKCVTVYCL